MDIPPEKEQDLQNTYGKGAKMLMKMGLQAERLENSPIDAKPNVGRQGLGFQKDNINSKGKLHGKVSTSHRAKNQNTTGPSEDPRFNPFTSPKPGYSGGRGAKGRGYPSPRTLSSTKDRDFEGQSRCHGSAATAGGLNEAFERLIIEAKALELRCTDSDESQSDEFEFLHIKDNIQLIAEYCEEELHKNEAKLSTTTEELVSLKRMENDLCQQIDGQYKFIQDLERLKNVISAGGEEPSGDIEKRLTEYYQVFKAVQEKDFVWEKLRFYRYVAPTVVPLLKREIEPDWNPLEDPFRPAPLYVMWNNLLRDKPEEFETIIRETYIPPLKTAIKSWDGDNPRQVTQLLKFWAPIFPQAIKTEIKNEVWPKFNHVIASWDPSGLSGQPTSVTPNWLQKWKKLFDSKFRIAIQKVCDRVEMTLGKWYPTENWALNIITDWDYTFSDRQMDQIMYRIGQKLEINLSKTIFSAENNDTEVFDAVLLWSNLLSPKKIYKIFEKSFFPNWLCFISHWLKDDSVDLEDVRNWYLFWRNRFPKELWELSELEEQFTKALQLMNTALETRRLIEETANLSVEDNLPSMARSQRERDLEAEEEEMINAAKFLDKTPTTFRDLLQKKCEEKGILFFPVGKTSKDGKQVYRCKKDCVYLDAGVIYVKREVWLPISMKELLDE